MNHLGQMSIEVAPTFHMYGRALLKAAMQKNSVFGEKAEQVNPTPGVASSSEDVEGMIFHLIIAVAVDPILSEEDLDDDEGRGLDDIEIPMADDLELAWENLDVARLIYAKDESSMHKTDLAEVHISLGDVSLESENFEQAIKDYEIALQIKLEFAPTGYRELAEAHFKLSLAYELSELTEEAIEQVHAAMGALRKRVEFLESSSDCTGKGKEIQSENSSSASKEIEELNGFLTELSSKVASRKLILADGYYQFVGKGRSRRAFGCCICKG